MNKIILSLSMLALSSIATPSHADSERTMLVLDASGSMWGQLEGKTKIEIAREAMATLVKDWPDGREAGLVAYGHRKKGDCSDIETLIPAGPLDAEVMIKTVNSLNPKGKTPLSAAVKQAAEALKFTEEKATVVLLSDGKETCDMDPCALGTELEKLGVDFTAHVIGFDVTKTEDQAGLRCLAENTGGQFIPAGNTEELNAALEQTAKAPEPEPEPTPQANIIAPASAIKATAISVELDAEEGLKGQIQLHTPGEKKQLAYSYVRDADVTGYKPSILRLPALTGDFELRWVNEKGKTIATAPITLTEAEIMLVAPDSAPKGTMIQVEVEAPEGLKGQIKLFAKGETKSLAYNYVRAGTATAYQPIEIRLPAQTGDFELKWLTQKGEVIAEKPITLTEAEITLLAPESAPMGTAIQVEVEAPEGLKGQIKLFAKGKKKSMAYNYVRAGTSTAYQPTDIRLPALTGDFELKWLTQKGEVIAQKPITLTEAEITLLAPKSAPKGTIVEVELEAPEGLKGQVKLFAKGKKKSLAYNYVRSGDIQGYKPVAIRLPAMTGDFELRWLTQRGENLASAPITLEDIDVSLDAPEQIEKGTKIPVTLNAPDGLDGQIKLYPKGKKKRVAYSYVRPADSEGYKPSIVKMPDMTGDYVLRWETNKNEVLTERAIQVVDQITE